MASDQCHGMRQLLATFYPLNAFYEPLSQKFKRFKDAMSSTLANSIFIDLLVKPVSTLPGLHFNESSYTKVNYFSYVHNTGLQLV